MKKDKLFMIFMCIYLIVLLFFSTSYNIINVISTIFLIINIIYLFKNKVKLDKKDILLLLLPFAYLLILIFRLNKMSFISNVFAIICNASIALATINFRRIANKNKVNNLLLVLQIITIISFIISFISYQNEAFFSNIGILSPYTDTYYNSIDRYYGLLCYCNASAVLFLISMFISLLKEDKEILDYLFLYISFIGFSYTFSKMIMICFIVVLLIYIVYCFIFKKYDKVKSIVWDVLSILIPVCLSITTYRTYLINYNLIEFFTNNLIIFIVYYLLITYVFKNKYIKLVSSILIVCILSFLLFKPVSIPLKINNIQNSPSTSDNYYITEFILEDKKEYTINIDYEVLSGDVHFVLEKAFVKNNRFDSYDYISINDEFNITGSSDAEYYLLSIRGLDENTNVKINKITVNGKKQDINTLLVPYQITRQLELAKYDKESVSHRIDYYKDSLKYLKKSNYIYGRGVDTFKYYRLVATDNNYNEKNPHSILFEYWLDVGIIGPIYLLIIYFSGIYFIFKNRKNSKNLIYFSLFVIVCMFSVFDFYMHIYGMRLLMLLFYIILICVDERKIIEKQL